MSRNSILVEVANERTIQENQGNSPAWDDTLAPWDWMAVLTRHLGKAVNKGREDADEARFRLQMVRVAALAVAAVEAQDRRTGRSDKFVDDKPAGPTNDQRGRQVG